MDSVGYAVSDRLHILQHAAGLDQYGRRPCPEYRNYFFTGPGTTNWPTCCVLVDEGLLVISRGPSELTGGSTVFQVTRAGFAYVAEHSPAPPKLTRSQQRYRTFLRADCGTTFGEYLKGYR